MPDGKPPSTGLGILVDEKKVNDLITQKTGAKAMIKSMIMLSLFITFLGLFTFLALSEPRSDFYAFEGYVRRRFDVRAAMPLHEVKSATNFWQYLNRSFIPGLYGNDTEPYFYPDFSPESFLLMGDANRLLGVGRLRMQKVLPNEGCPTTLVLPTLDPICYGHFSKDKEDKVNFGPPNMITGDNVFPHTSVNVQHLAGKIASYPSGAFMRPFTSDYNDTINDMKLMMDNDFVSASTRVVALDWTIYNFNTGYYAVCRILFEVAASGNWITTFDVDILMTRHLNPIKAIFLDGDWLPLVGQVLLLLFVLGYALEEMSEFVGFRGGRPYIKVEYFGDPWNLLDWLNLTLIVWTFGQMVTVWRSAPGEFYTADPRQAGLNTFADLSTTAEGVRAATRLTAFNIVLTWFKAVKYIAILPYITTFMETVTMTQRAIRAFAAIFFTVLFGFVLAYSVAFGEQISDLRTPWDAFVFLMRSFVGNADMTVVLDASPFLSSVLMFLFVLSMVFVILNVFFAIMISALADAKAKASEDKAGGWQQVKERSRDLWNTMSKEFRLEHRFRTCVPGLYSRIMLYRKKVAEKELERDANLLRKEHARNPVADVSLGPGDPSIGRRPKRAANSLSLEDASDSDNGSEVDLGPLGKRSQLTGKLPDFGAIEGPQGNFMHLSSEGSGAFLSQDGAGGDEDLTEDGIKLVIKATQHIADGIVDRTHGARGVLFGEMNESKEVLLKVASVLEILAQRARDLEAQQEHLLNLL